MTIVFLLGFGAIALAAVLLPLLSRSDRATSRPGEGSGRVSLDEGETAALAALRDLEFDHRLGKLAEEDYGELRAQLARRAVAELKAMDKARQAEAARVQEIDELIEREVAVLRRAWQQPAADPLRECPACSKVVGPGDHFCAACGAALPHTCPDCGAALPADAQFCPQCARALPGSVTVSLPELDELIQGAPARAAQPNPIPTRSATSRRTPLSKWLLVAGAAAVLWAGVVGIFYFRARAAIEAQQPIATLVAAGYRALAMLPADPNFAFLGHPGGLMWSSDGGVNWQPASVTGEVLALAVHPAGPLRIYAAGPGLFLRSDDGGRKWAEVAVDLPGRDIQALAVAPDNPEIVYAFIVGQGLWRSENGGLNWRPVDITLAENVTTLAVTPGAIYAGTDGVGVLRSSDGGATWASANGFVNGALDSPRVRALVYDPTTQMLYAGTDRGLSFTTNASSGWTRRPFSGNVAALALGSDGATMLLVTSAGEVFRSRDRGVTWRNQ